MSNSRFSQPPLPPEGDFAARLTRWGVRVFQRVPGGRVVGADDVVHHLNEHEQAELRAIQRRAIIKAAIAGALSGLACAIAAWLLDSELDGSRVLLRYWLPLGVAMILATAVEIGFLYVDALRSTAQMADAAGMGRASEAGAEAWTETALVRAALELPLPPDVLAPVTAAREVSRIWLILTPLLYKLKVSATSLVLKFFVGRYFGRVVGRAYLEFVGVPVFAIWDAVVTWWVLREVRLRVMGPSAARLLTGLVFAEDQQPSAQLHDAVALTLAAVVARNRDLHPNLGSLLTAVQHRIGELDPEGLSLDDESASQALRRKVPGLSPMERTTIQQLLAVGIVLDGRVSRWERELYEQFCSEAGLAPEWNAVQDLRQRFTQGQLSDGSGVRLPQGRPVASEE